MTRVLVVEDDTELREVLVLALEQEGYDVSAAENGLDAIVCLNFGVRPDAVVLNLHMPVMSGADFMEAMRHEPAFSELPVVVVSGAPVPTAVARAAEAVLAKPFDIYALSTAIDAAVALGHGRQPDGEPPARDQAGL